MKGSKLFSYPWVIDMSLENHWSVTFIRRCIDFLTTCACIICYLIDIAVDHLIRWPSTTLLEGLEAASSGCKIAPSTLGYSLISSGVPHSLFPQWWEFILEGALSRAPRPCRVSPQEALRRKILLLLHHPISIMCSSPVNCAVEMGGWTFLACRASRRSLLPHSLSFLDNSSNCVLSRLATTVEMNWKLLHFSLSGFDFPCETSNSPICMCDV